MFFLIEKIVNELTKNESVRRFGDALSPSAGSVWGLGIAASFIEKAAF